MKYTRCELLLLVKAFFVIVVVVFSSLENFNFVTLTFFEGNLTHA